MRSSFWLAVLLCALFISGCARHRTKLGSAAALSTAAARFGGTNALGSAQALIVSAENGLLGKVVRANRNLRFVVLNFPITRMPALEQRLIVYRHGLKVGELKVGGPQQDDNIVADITAGEAEAEDEARDQ